MSEQSRGTSNREVNLGISKAFYVCTYLLEQVNSATKITKTFSLMHNHARAANVRILLITRIEQNCVFFSTSSYGACTCIVMSGFSAGRGTKLQLCY
jgi:hypothetical protein